jgi:uncharacterized membrane protein HdeD (DUF308 family)
MHKNKKSFLFFFVANLAVYANVLFVYKQVRHNNEQNQKVDIEFEVIGILAGYIFNVNS